MEIRILKNWVRNNKHNMHKLNLIDYLQGKICKYASQENTPAEQIKGMNRILRDIINLDDENWEEK